MFYGIIIYMYFFDNRKHYKPHIHAFYGENEAIIAIETSEILSGGLPTNKMKLVEAWIVIHRDELMANWKLATDGLQLYQIEPLK